MEVCIHHENSENVFRRKNWIQTLEGIETDDFVYSVTSWRQGLKLPMRGVVSLNWGGREID